MKSIVLHNPVEHEWFCNTYFIIRPLLRYEAKNTFQTVFKFDEHEIVLYTDHDFFNHLKYLRQLLEGTDYLWKEIVDNIDVGYRNADDLLHWIPYPYESVLETASIPGLKGIYYVVVSQGDTFLAGQRDLHGRIYLAHKPFETIEEAKVACSYHVLALAKSLIYQDGCPPFLLSDFLENEND